MATTPPAHHDGVDPIGEWSRRPVPDTDDDIDNERTDELRKTVPGVPEVPAQGRHTERAPTQQAPG
jgi:hypothetical protein